MNIQDIYIYIFAGKSTKNKFQTQKPKPASPGPSRQHKRSPSPPPTKPKPEGEITLKDQDITELKDIVWFYEWLSSLSAKKLDLIPTPPPTKPKPEPTSNIREIIKQFNNRPKPEPKPFQPVRSVCVIFLIETTTFKKTYLF